MRVQALFVVIDDPTYVVPILDRFMELGLTGATVIDSMGMARVIGDHVPFFGRFAHMDGERHHNKTIFTVVSDEQLEEAANAIDEVVGGLHRPETAFLFSVQVSMCRGLSSCNPGFERE